MIALCPKCYTSFNYDDDTNTINENIKVIAKKIKGVSLKQNKHITPESYYQCLVNGVKFDGQNVCLQMKRTSGSDEHWTMSRITVSKTALTSCHTKAVCCMPFILGARYASLDA